MSAPQNNTGDDASGYTLSAFISDPAEAKAMYNKLVQETGCTAVRAKFIPAPDDQGVAAESETGTASVGTANSNISAESPSAENDSSTKK